jgi:hypothetical protein
VTDWTDTSLRGRANVEEKSNTTFSFSLSPGFLSFLREKFSLFLWEKKKKKSQTFFSFSFSFSGFSQFSQRNVFSSLLHLGKSGPFGFFGRKCSGLLPEYLLPGSVGERERKAIHVKSVGENVLDS